MYGYIYLTENLINGKRYIGQHKGKFDYSYLGSGKLIKRAIKKHGKENFLIDVLYTCNTKEELNEKEIQIIKEMDAVNSGGYYNISIGGDGGNIDNCNNTILICSHCGKIGNIGVITQWHEENCNMTEQGKAKRIEFGRSKAGEKSPMYGKEVLEETRKKLSEAQIGKKHSEKSKKKISEALSGEKHPMYGKNYSKEHKKKISESLKGENHPMYGKTLPEETKKKISESHKGKKHSEESKKKISEASKGRIYDKVECPHCGFTGGGGNMKRYHFNNCKKKE